MMLLAYLRQCGEFFKALFRSIVFFWKSLLAWNPDIMKVLNVIQSLFCSFLVYCTIRITFVTSGVQSKPFISRIKIKWHFHSLSFICPEISSKKCMFKMNAKATIAFTQTLKLVYSTGVAVTALLFWYWYKVSKNALAQAPIKSPKWKTSSERVSTHTGN